MQIVCTYWHSVQKHVTQITLFTGNICRSTLAEAILRHLVAERGESDKVSDRVDQWYILCIMYYIIIIIADTVLLINTGDTDSWLMQFVWTMKIGAV